MVAEAVTPAPLWVGSDHSAFQIFENFHNKLRGIGMFMFYKDIQCPRLIPTWDITKGPLTELATHTHKVTQLETSSSKSSASPHCSVVKNPPVNTGSTGSIPDLGNTHRPQRN